MAGGTADGLVFFVVVEGIAVPGNTVFAIEVNIAGTAVFGLELARVVICTIIACFAFGVFVTGCKAVFAFTVALKFAARYMFCLAVSSVHGAAAEFCILDGIDAFTVAAAALLVIGAALAAVFNTFDNLTFRITAGVGTIRVEYTLNAGPVAAMAVDCLVVVIDIFAGTAVNFVFGGAGRIVGGAVIADLFLADAGLV